MTRIQLPTSCIAADNPGVVALSRCYSSGNAQCDPTWPLRLLSRRSCAILPTAEIANSLFSQTVRRRLQRTREESTLPRRLHENFLQLRRCDAPSLAQTPEQHHRHGRGAPFPSRDSAERLLGLEPGARRPRD